MGLGETLQKCCDFSWTMNLAHADGRKEDTSGWRGGLLEDNEHIFQHRRAEFPLKNPEKRLKENRIIRSLNFVLEDADLMHF